MATARNGSEEDGQGQRFVRKFVELERLKPIPRGYRLASVDDLRSDEAKQQLRKQRVIKDWDIVRLRDGWIEGRGYSNLRPTPEFRPGMGHKLAINRRRCCSSSSSSEMLSARINGGEGDAGSWIRELLYECEEVSPTILSDTEFREVVAALLRQPSGRVLPVDEETGWTALHSACVAHNVSFLRDVVMAELRKAGILDELINKKTSEREDINFVYTLVGKQWTPLHVAVTGIWGCNAETIELLLENGADPNILDANGRKPFLLGVQRHDCLPLVKPLLHSVLPSGVDPHNLANNLVKPQLKEALQYIASARIDANREVAKYLFENILRHFDFDDNINMYDLMCRAMKNSHAGSLLDDLLKFLPTLSRNPHLSSLVDEKGRTLLHHAVILSRNSRRSVDSVIENCIKPLLSQYRNHTENLTDALEAQKLFWAEDSMKRIAYDYVRYEFEKVQTVLVDDFLFSLDTQLADHRLETSLQMAARLRKVHLFNRLLKSIRRDDVYRVLNEQLEEYLKSKKLDAREKVNVMEVWMSHRLETILHDKQELEQHVKQATDQPTEDDILGRKPLADALATLLLNPFVGTPITIGIYGDWGIGKSSVMLQMEIRLFQIAIEQIYKKMVSGKNVHTNKITNIIGCVLKSLDPQDKQKLKNVELWEADRHLRELWEAHRDLHLKERILKEFASKYNKRYHSIYATLALLDILKLTQEEWHLGSSITRACHNLWKFIARVIHYRNSSPTTTTDPSHFLQESTSTMETNRSVAGPGLSLPSILTVHYNAWQYQNENQALAGLANEVTKEIESAMNTAQWLSMCWCNSMTGRHHGRPPILFFCSSLFILGFSGLVTWLIWVLLSSSSNSDLQALKYGSLPLAVISIFWAVLQRVHAFIQPVSKSLMAMFSPINHEMNLGYHQHIVGDIQFLLEELHRPPSWIWRCLGVFANMIGQNRDYVAGTKIPKQIPSENLRVVVFVDDLDRCSDHTVFQVLTSINLVLSVCEFNVVLGVDKSVILRVIKSKFAEKAVQLLAVPYRVGDISAESSAEGSSTFLENMAWAALPEGERPEDMAEKFLEKIVQLPVVLPDPGAKKVGEFLEGQMGFRDRKPRRGTSLQQKVGVRVEPAPRMYIAELEIEDEDDELDGTEFSNNQSDERDGEEGSDDTGRLFARYTADECMILKGLQIYTKGEVTNPREWKRLLNYHRLAYNVVSQNEEKAMERIVDWKAELIVWVFVCWHWKDLMNEIIEDWDILLSPQVDGRDFSLNKIVQAKLQNGCKKKDTMKWEAMREALSKNDVSMKGIEMFQDFRFQCKQGYLQFP